MSKTSYSKAKGRRSVDEYFVKLTHELLESPAWADLSLRARDIFVRMTKKYDGKNNGDISVTLAELRREGELKSPASLTKALDELWRHGFIVLTREGSFGSLRICNLWALTTWPINDIPRKGIKGTRYASNDWRHWYPGKDARDYCAKFPKVKAKRAACQKNTDSCG